MLVEEALYKLLSANPGLSSLVSARIFPGVLAQTVTYPAIAYRVVGRDHVERLESRASGGLANSRIRFFSVAKGGVLAYAMAKAVDEALRLALQGFSGEISDGASPETTLTIDGIFPISTLDFYDDPTQTHQIASDFDVWATEQQPTP